MSTGIQECIEPVEKHLKVLDPPEEIEKKPDPYVKFEIPDVFEFLFTLIIYMIETHSYLLQKLRNLTITNYGRSNL